MVVYTVLFTPSCQPRNNIAFLEAKIAVDLQPLIKVTFTVRNSKRGLAALRRLSLHRVLSKRVFPRNGIDLFRHLRVEPHYFFHVGGCVHSIKIGLADCFAFEVELFLSIRDLAK